MVEGKKAYAMSSTQHYFFERTLIDSAGYLKDVYNGTIIFSGVNLGETIFENEDLYTTTTSIDSVISVPAGNFKTVNFKMCFKNSGQKAYHFYANGVGLVKQVYLSNETKKEHNLIRYTISKE
jgi:hypothetical protein